MTPKKFVCFKAITGSNAKSGKSYALTSYDALVNKAENAFSSPRCEKADAWAFLASSYNASDAREEKVQREHGLFNILVADVDNGNLSLEQVCGALNNRIGSEFKWLVYSTASALEGNMKWRVVIPLQESLDGQDFIIATIGLFDDLDSEFSKYSKATCDRAMARCAQPSFFPVIQASVDVDKKPSGKATHFELFCNKAENEFNAKESGSFNRAKDAIETKRKADEEKLREVEAQRAAYAAERLSSISATSGAKGSFKYNPAEVIEVFNKTNSVSSLFSKYGYLSGYGQNYRSPNSTSGSFAVKLDSDDQRWVSLSGSDYELGIGGRSSSITCCWGDAYDLFKFYECGDSPALALKEASKLLGMNARSSSKQTAVAAFEDFQDSNESNPAYDEALELILEATNHVGLLAATTKIKRFTGLQKVDIESLANHLKRKATEVGSKLDIKSCRDLLFTSELKLKDAEDKAIGIAKFNEFVESSSIISDWVYLEKTKKFFNVKDNRSVEVQSFNMIHDHETPKDIEGNAQSASRFFALNGGRTVYREMYLPSFYSQESQDRFFVYEGIAYKNSYRGWAVPSIAEGWEDREHYKVVRDHIYGLFEDVSDANVFVSFLAYCVQRPGERILWSPVVLGVQGDGKTTIARMLGAVMGSENVRTISLDEIYSAFSSWAEGACVRVIEEIRISGKSRHDVMNKLKPYITNDLISVVKKGQDAFEILNTQNYLCFTNHADALPLDIEDRRWAVFKTKFNSREELLQERSKEYWQELNEVINKHAEDVRGWLCSIDLSAFDPNSAPLLNKAKANMIKETLSENVTNIAGVLEHGGYGFNDVVCSPMLLGMGLKKFGFRSPNLAYISKALYEKLGFVAIDPLKVNGKTYRIYVNKEFLKDNGLKDFEKNDSNRVTLSTGLREIVRLRFSETLNDFD